jgi:hypothetical protein
MLNLKNKNIFSNKRYILRLSSFIKDNHMSRIQKLETIYKEQLEHKDIQNISKFIQSIVDADITKGKYARFLIEAFLNDKFLEEDLVGGFNSTVGQAITLFDKHKHKLPVHERSVYALNKETGEALYQSPGDLWNSVKQYQGELSGKELKREEQEQIYRETEFIYKDEETGFQIVSPLTEESAKWWGKGTRWCTSAENNNRFWNYAKNAPLLILLIPNVGIAGNGEKLQLWNNGNDIQFMDEVDNEVELKYIEQHWKLLEPICLWLNDFRFIPDKSKTQDICLNVFTKNLWALEYIPEHLKTEELFRLAVKQNGKALYYVPDELITPELCKLAVQQNEEALEYVPYNLKTKELCELAIEQDGKALCYVPEELRTHELCELAVQQEGSALHYVPNKLITEKICKLAVQNNGLALYHVPEKLITNELCKLAVQQNGWALNHIPEHLKTKEICKLAVQSNGCSLDCVPEQYKTKEMCELAIKQYGGSLYFVPEELRTHELCKLAVQNNGLALADIPKKLRIKELCKIALQQNGLNLEHVPDEYKTKEICELAVKQNGEALYYVTYNLRTKELCELAVKQNEEALEYVPKELQKHVKNNILKEIPMEKYQDVFQEIKTIFPEKNISLNIK